MEMLFVLCGAVCGMVLGAVCGAGAAAAVLNVRRGGGALSKLSRQERELDAEQRIRLEKARRQLENFMNYNGDVMPDPEN